MKADAMQTRTRSFDRMALIGVTLAGMAICAPGIARVAAAGSWLTFQGIAGSLLGMVVLVIAGARLLGKEMPGIASDRAALLVVVAIAVVKMAIAVLQLGA